MRTLRKVPDDQWHTCKMETSDGLWIGSWRTIFGGYRIVLGEVNNDRSLLLNWCCGNNAYLFRRTYYMLARMLEAGVEIKELPMCSDVKPWPNDVNFTKKVVDLFVNYCKTNPTFHEKENNKKD